MISDIATIQYTYVTTSDDIDVCVQAMRDSEVIGLDIETTGLDCFKDKIRLLQIATDNNVYIIDFFLTNKQEIEIIGNALRQSKAVKLFHNGKFDLKFLWKYGIPLAYNIFDTFLAERIIASGAVYRGFGLEDVAFKYVGIRLDKSFQKSDWTKQPTKEQLQYCTMDAYVLRPIHQEQVKILNELHLMDTAILENQVLVPTVKLELAGIKLDKKPMRDLTMNLIESKMELLEDLNILLPSVKNFNSPLQIKDALQKLGLNIKSTEKEELSKFSNSHIEVEKILAYKKVTKNISLLEGLKKSIHPVTGRVHADYSQCSTTTGRYKAKEPNVQGIPNTTDFRKCIVADEGKLLVISDFSQIELRIIAELANDQEMLTAFRNGEDIHKRTAALINGKPVDEVTKDERQNAKALNFGLVYGMGYNGFKMYAQNKYGVVLTDNEVKEQVNKFFEMYSGVSERLNTLYGLFDHEERTVGGRRRLWTQRPIITERANAAVQGTGADILKKAMIEVEKHLLNDYIKLTLIVHDEIVLEVPESEAETVATKLKELMEGAGRIYLKSVPVIADVVIGKSWAEK